MSVGEKIAELRKKQNMTQYDLGQAMNVSYQAVSKWERDESQPDFFTLSKIAKLFNVPLSYFEEGGSAEMPAASYHEIPAAKQLAGTCTECGKVVYAGEEGETEPKLLCAVCHEKKEAERRIEREKEEARREQIAKKAAEFDRGVRKWHRRSFGWSTFAAIIVYIICVAVPISEPPFFKEHLVESLLTSFLLPILAYAAVSRLIWFCAQADGSFDDDEPKYRIAPSMIIAAIFSAANIVMCIVFYCCVNFIDVTTFAVSLTVFTVLAFTFMSQFLWNGVVRKICFAGGLIVKLPGIIFTLDIDGIVFFILVKILFGIIVILIFFISVLICEIAAMAYSLFSFVPSLIRRLKAQKEEI